MKRKKQFNRLFAFVLAIALAIPVLGGQNFAKASDTVTVTLRIEQDNATLLAPVSVTLTEDDKKNDFGIGLSTDETAAYSPLRAFAKYLTEKGVKKEDMSKYIIAAPSEWGGLYVTGLSTKGDGIGAASSEKLDNVYWMYNVNNESGAVSMSEYALKNGDSVVIYGIWSPYPASEEILYSAFDKAQYSGKENQVELTLTGYGTSYDDPDNPKAFQKPIEGASVTAYQKNKSSVLLSTLTNKEGKAVIQFPASDKKTTYILTAAKKAKDGKHHLISRPYTVVTVPASAPSVKKPDKVTGVKAKVKKAKGKTKTIVLTWNKAKKADGYQIYISKKKKSGYKKKAEVKKTTARIHCKKGTWYVKIRAYKKISGKKTTGTYSSIKQIKVK